MTFTNEQIKKAKSAKTPEELITLAKAEGIELSEENAAALFKNISAREAELSMEELDNVAGGCGGNRECLRCGGTNTCITSSGSYGQTSFLWVCRDCGCVF